jgi:hypothetical protein
MEKIDAFFVLLVIVAIIMAPLHSTGYATMQSPGMMGEGMGMEDYQHQQATKYGFEGLPMVKSTSPQGASSYSIGSMPVQVHTNTPTHMGADFRLINMNDEVAQAEFRCYKVNFNDFRNGSFEISRDSEPYYTENLGNISPGATLNVNCPATSVQNVSEMAPRNIVESALASIGNGFTSMFNFARSFFDLEPLPLEDPFTKKANNMAMYDAVVFTDGVKTSETLSLVTNVPYLPGSENMPDPVGEKGDVSFDPPGLDTQGEISFDPPGLDTQGEISFDPPGLDTQGEI